VESPEEIPAKGDALLVVRFHPGVQGGRKAVAFRVWTDRPEQPVRTLTLRSELIPEATATAIEGRNQDLLMKNPGKQVLRIAIRRYGKEGRSAPSSVEGTIGLKARFLGEPTDRLLENGVRESTRDVLVDLPARDRPGSQAGLLTFRWPDGHRWEAPVQWTVTPHLRASPEALILGRGDISAPRSVLVRSQSDSFRVLGVEGGTAGPASPETPLDRPSRSHLVRLGFDPGKLPASGAFDVTIRTDHPAQPEVVVSVLIASTKPGDRP
jgi:hypothetical protein